MQMHQRGYTWRRPRRPRPERAPALRRGPQVQRRDLCGLAPLVEGRRFILAGDWNTARHQGTERDSRAGEEFFARVREELAGTTAWDKLRDEVRTWFREGDHLLQDDYVFCDPSLGETVDEVSVAEDAATERHLSDHASLIVNFRYRPNRGRDSVKAIPPTGNGGARHLATPNSREPCKKPLVTGLTRSDGVRSASRKPIDGPFPQVKGGGVVVF